MAGRSSAIRRHETPSSDEPNNDPVDVPKYTPAGASGSTAIASRSTPMCACSWGRPLAWRSQVSPPSTVRYTAAAPSGMVRPLSGGLSGMVQAICGSRGWAAMTNPKSDGSEPVISCHVAPPSSERYMPQWFCW
jgi:hypothetical protein